MKCLLLFLVTIFLCLNIGGSGVSAQTVLPTEPQKLNQSEEEAKRAIEARLAASIKASCFTKR